MELVTRDCNSDNPASLAMQTCSENMDTARLKHLIHWAQYKGVIPSQKVLPTGYTKKEILVDEQCHLAVKELLLSTLAAGISNKNLEAVVAMLSMASMMRCRAESAPIVMSVPQKSLSIEPTNPTIFRCAHAAAFSAVILPTQNIICRWIIHSSNMANDCTALWWKEKVGYNREITQHSVSYKI